MRKFYLVNSGNFRFCIVLLCLVFSLTPNSILLSQTVSFTTAGTTTWICPAGVTSLTVESWGAGGAGGGVTTASTSGGGGGGGAYTKLNNIIVVPGIAYNVVVGAGGIGTIGNGPAGGNSYFNISTALANGGSGGGANNGAGGAGGAAGTFKGGNGAAGVTANSGGGGGSAGTASAGNNASGITGGTAVAGGGAGANGFNTNGIGGNGGVPGGGGSGARKGTGTAQNTGGNGATGKVIITYETYKVSFSGLSFGSTTWCTGESRNVTLTVTNVGTASWTSGGGAGGINFSYWWSNQSGQDANPRILPFSNLAPGASQNISIPITAPVSATPITLNFDLVKETYCWFRGNGTPCAGPGNSTFISSAITISALPAITTQPSTSSQNLCQNAPATALAVVATGSGITYQWFSNTTASNSGGSVISGATSSSYVPLTTTVGTLYYYSVVSGSCSPAAKSNVSGAIIVNAKPITPGGVNDSRCGPGVVSVSASPASGETIDWYDAASGGTLLLAGNTNYTTPSISVTQTYYAESRNTITGCKSATRTAVIATINTIPNAPTGTNGSRCGTGTVDLSAAPAAGETIDWYDASSGGTILSTGSNSFTTPVLSTTTIYYAESRNTTSGCISATRTAVTAKVVDPVIITSGPTPTTQTICATFPATFTISATGDATSYQWYLNGSALTDNTNISGATTATLNIDQVSAGDAGLYHVVINGTAPCGNVTSSDAVLIVNQQIFITSQPASQTLCVGNTATFSIAATGTTLSYKWRKGTTYLIDGGNISGATTSTLSLANISAGDAGNYNVEISDGTAGCATANSANAALTVNATSVGGTVGTSTSVCSGSNSGTLNLTGKIGNVLNWEFSSNGGISWTSIANTTTSQTYTNLTQTTLYRAVVKSGVCPSDNSIPATITVNPIPDAVATPSNQAICSGTAVTTIALTGSVPATTFNWTRNNTGVSGIANSGSGDISGTLTNTTAAPVTVTFTITPTANSCVGSVITATVVVNPTPNASATPASQTKCSGAAITTIALSSATTGTTYTWSRDNNASVTGIVASGSGNISGTLTNTTASPVTVTFTITPSANGCIGTPITATVLVNPTPNAIATPSSQTICSGTAITTIALTSNTSGTTFTWTRNNPAGISGIALSGSGDISGTLTNATASTVTVTFTITPTANTCSGTAITANVVVYPVPNALRTPSSQTICSGNTITTIAITGQVPTTTFTWTRNNTATVTGIAASGGGDISGNLTNTTAAAITVTFTITPSANGCPGLPVNATVLVNPTPVAVATPSSQTKCSGSAITTIVLSSATSPTTYTWTRDNTGPVTGIAASGTGNISGILNNTTAAPITVTFTITPTSNSCAGNSITATVLVNPKPVAGSITGPSTVCIGSAINLNSSGTGIAPLTYTWSSSNAAVVTVNNASVVTGVGTGTANITYTVSDGNGCSTTSAAFAVTVTKPTANAITQASGISIVCVGSTLNLTSNAIGTAPLSYTWLSSNTAKATVTNSGVVSGVAAGTANITYTVTDGNGCSTTSTAYNITVNAIPTGTLTATETSGTGNNDGTICAGASVTFTATAGYGAYNFKVNGTSVQNGTANIYSTTLLTNGASVTVDVANSVNCGATFAPVVITVTSLPTPTLTAAENSGIPNNNVICAGDNVTFTAGGGNSYVFKVNGSSVQSGASNTFSSAALTNGASVTVAVTNINGCTATSSPIVITVNAVPSGTLSTPSTSVCAGDNVIFTATGGFANYDFRVNGSSIQNSAANTFSSSTLANASVVTVVVTNSSGCTATFNALAVTVNPLPTGTLSATENSGIPDNNSICAGSPVTFTFNSGYSNYNFKVNGSTQQSGSSNSYINTTLNNGDAVMVVVTNGSSCSATFTAPAITVVASPTGSLTSSPTAICAGDNVVFTATAGFENYNFMVNGASVQNGSSNTFSSITLLNGDVVTVDVTNLNSCTTTFNSITLTINPLPTGTLVPVENSGNMPDDGIICTGTTVIFTAPIGYSNYDFILNGGTVQSGASNTYFNTTLSNGDNVQVAITNANGCIGLLNTIGITVNPLPAVAPITGTYSVCENNTTTLADATSGGTWSSANISVATIDAAGVVTGVSAGTATINYTFTNSTTGCSNTISAIVTVNALPIVAAITGNLNVCTGSTSQLSDATSGGLWSSSNTAIATVNSSGLVSGVSAGTVTIGYFVTDGNGCSTTITANVTVSDLPVVAAITGNTNVCVSSTTALSDATTGGTWSSDNISVATVDGSTGVVTGVTPGTANIIYTITTSCSQTASASVTITVTASPSATITYTGDPFCTTSIPVVVNQTGTSGGTYSSTSGLTINSADGTITPATSTGGTYTVTYTITAAGGCGIYTTTTSVTITTAPSATIAYGGGSFCTSAASVNVTRTGTAGGTYSSAAGLTLNTATGAITPATSTGGTYTVTYSIAASGNCAAFTTSTSVTITPAPSATISYAGSPFCTSSGVSNVTRTGTAGGTYSAPAGLSLNTSTGAITPASSTGGIYTVTYTIAASGGCAAFTTTTSVTITSAPTAVAGTPVLTCSNTGAVNITGGSSATNQSNILWTSNGTGTFTNATSLTTATYSPSAADIAAGSRTLTLTVNGNGSCAAVSSSKIITISAPPAAFIITPASASVCTGDVQPLTATASTPTTGSTTISSGALNVAIPDASGFIFITPGRVTTNMAVAGIPAGAVINSMSVKFNITHTYDGDLELNLKAPNGNVLNLVNERGGSGNNFVNTIISSNGVTPVNSGTAPFTNTYTADATNGTGNPNSNVTAFSSLFSLPNGTWVFGAEDEGPGDVGTITSWSLTFNYTIPNLPLAVTWTPITDLYSDAGATIAYAGQALSTVYSKAATSGTKTYTATTTNAANCSTTKTVVLTVNPKPVVTISADYCIVAGKVRLTANSTPAATSYIWSTGATTQFIDVDVAGSFDVTAFGAGSCPGAATINVASELVFNGDFSAGPTGFFTEYTQNQAFYNGSPASGLYPEGYYAVNTSAYSPSNGVGYHPSFHGRDHTTGSGNFLMINGSTTPIGNPARLRTIWEQTVTVLPNTNYYFSAWGMNLNPAVPAQLQFEVNGVAVGTIADLNTAPKPTTEAQVNLANWVRFYSNPTWTSGPTTTTAVIRIINLNTAAGGNDFGLDDISFGTLSTFVTLESTPGTDAQTSCINAPITNIVYSTGSSASGPTVTGLPPGVTSSFNGELLTISGSPTVAGNYAYTVTTTGTCNPASASGTITVQSQSITLNSGSSSPTVCTNTPVNISYALSGTATGATVSGLPAGVTSSVTGTTLTISGTPTVAGAYTYTVTTSGSCTAVTATGTITVQAQIITLNTGNNTQPVCINSSIANIQYSISGTANGASASGLPVGVTGTYSGGFFIISGTPTSAAGSPYNYIVTTTGALCTAATATGTITVTPGGSLSLTSGAGTNPQTVCKGAAITDITYAVINATGASASGLPAGVTGTYSSGVFTISGTTTANAGTYNYTVTTSGGCAPGTATGTITVQAQTITLTSGSASPSVCANTAMPNIVYTIGGTATTATVTGLPASLSGFLSGNTFTISGTPTAVSGAYTYTVNLSGTCALVTATGTITIQPAAIGGNLTSVSICSGGSGSLTLSGQTGAVQRWEYSTNGGTTWTSITNTTISQTFTNVTVPTLYRVVVSSGCSPVFSSVATVGIHNLWTGATSSDWFTASNWSDGLVPSMSCPSVTIPAVIAPNVYPILNTGIATVNNLIIKPTASFTITSGTLQVAGIISNSGTFNTLNGTIDMNGSSAQTIAANTFMNNDIKNLIISNTNAAGVTVGGPLNIFGKVSFGNGNNKVLASAGFINLKSTAAGTAMIADVTSGNAANNNNRITGNVVVERYYPGRRAWRLLTAPVSTSRTIYNEWQLGGVMATTAPGSGTFITKPFGTGNSSDGLEQSNNSSLKIYNQVNQQLVDVTNTNVPVSNNAQQVNVPDNIGYFMFVRGDRTPSLLNPYPITNFNITTLRDTGVLQTGVKTFGPVSAGNFMLIGNPYASPVDFGKLSLTNVQKKFWAWDPRLNATLGSYVLVDGQIAPGYVITPAPDPIIGTTGQDSIIQSSQAFFVQADGTGPGTVSFNESNKSTKDNNTVFRPVLSAANEIYESLRANLYLNDGDTAILADGVYEQYNNSFSAGIDGLDALKFTNFLENFGIVSNGKTLILERRPLVTENDTIFFNLWKTTQRNYQFRFITSGLNHPGLEGYLEDSYLKTKTKVDLNGYTNINFSITSDALSKVKNRFSIVFIQTIITPLPVTFTSVKAYQQSSDINVEWKVENEINIKQYQVERSTNGSSFIKVALVTAKQNTGNGNTYQWPDANPVNGMNYYRIRSVGLNGEIQYSNIVKVNTSTPVSSISIYPNPVTDGIINVHFVNQPTGHYVLRLMNKLGQVMLVKEIQHEEGTATEKLQPGKTWAHGTYQLEVTKPDNSKTDFNVLY